MFHCLNVKSISTVIHSTADGHLGYSQIFIYYKSSTLGLPWWLSGKESACRFRRHEFDPWLGKIPEALKQLSRLATTVESVLWSLGTATNEHRRHEDWSLCAPELRLHNKRNHHMRGLRPQLERGPAPKVERGPAPKAREGPCTTTREGPLHPKAREGPLHPQLEKGPALQG